MNKNVNIKKDCIKYHGDKNFLEHMINHHRVAIDMSQIVMKTTKSPQIMFLARNIEYLQKYDIWIMKQYVKYNAPNVSGTHSYKKHKKLNPIPSFSCYYPEMSSDKYAKCMKMMFSPLSKKQISEMKISDLYFLKHMIPHHQLAVGMSKEILQNSNNPFMLEFANQIIKAQQYEIWYMKTLIKYIYNNNLYHYKSTFI